jgi:hypothetical protein
VAYGSHTCAVLSGLSTFEHQTSAGLRRAPIIPLIQGNDQSQLFLENNKSQITDHR